MGCHTWFYKKWDISLEEAKSQLKEIIENSIAHKEQWEVEENLEYFIDLKNSLDTMSEKEIFEYFSGYNKNVCEYIEDKGLFIYTRGLPHDLFRKYGYPEDTLFSLEETLEYMYTPKNKCKIFDWSEELVRKFWEEYPNGMINFG